MKKRRRWLLTGLLLLPVIGAVALFAFTQGVRNAPLQIERDNPPQVISFVSNRSGNWDIFTLNPSGDLINLTDDGSDAHDYFVSWSLDARKMNFLSNRADPTVIGPSQMNPDGTEIQSLPILEAIRITFSQRLFDWDPVWSPDASRLAWISLRDLGLELYVIDHEAVQGDTLTMQDATRLTSNNPLIRDWFPAWSPDGRQIAYSSDAGGDENIYVVDVASVDQRQLTTDPERDVHAMWSLDGTQIAFLSERDESIATGNVNLYVMNADGSDQQLITADVRFEGDPLWSADGRYMLYVSNQTGNWHIYLRDLETEAVRRLTEGNADHLFPVWQPG